MKYLIVSLLLLPLIVPAQEIGLSILGSYSVAAKPAPSIYHAVPKFPGNYAGGQVRFDIVFKHLEVGLAGETQGYHGKGKILSVENAPSSFKDGSKLYTLGKQIGINLHINAKKTLLSRKLIAYGGITGGFIFPNASESYTYFNIDNPIYAGPNGTYLQVSCYDDQTAFFYGGQVGIRGHIIKGLSILLECDARRVHGNDKEGSIAIVDSHQQLLYSQQFTYQYPKVHYAFWYFPVFAGLNYTF